MANLAIGAFATSQTIFIKELGIRIAAGLLIDATAVRAFRVASLIALLGRWNWWAPRPGALHLCRLKFDPPRTYFPTGRP